MKQFKIRASAVTDIMADPRLKSEPISEGAKTYCKKWLKNAMFNREYFFTSKYTNKGIETEEDALNILVRVLKLGMVYKNEERKFDEYKSGECDFIYDGVIYDNKSSYSFDTFPLFETKLDPKYYGQMQVYMSLWELNKAKVCYTLVNTPIDILRKELKWIEDENERQQKALNHVFTEKYWKDVKSEFFPNADAIVFKSIEDKYRVKVFEVDRDDDYINKINIKVKLCRDYISTLLNGLK